MAKAAEIETSFDADPREVWETLTSPEGIEQWMGEGSVIDEDGDLWFRDFVTGEPKEGRVRHRDPGRRLDFDWWPEDDPGHGSSVSITLEPQRDGTLVRITEQPGAVSASASASVAGIEWNWRAVVVEVSVSERCLLGSC